jgi:hypothetical protein
LCWRVIPLHKDKGESCACVLANASSVRSLSYCIVILEITFDKVTLCSFTES